MHLTALTIINFRSLRELTVEFDRLTILIGENDTGKSSILDALNLCLSNSRPDATDFHKDTADNVADDIIIEPTFTLDDDDQDAEAYALDHKLCLRYTYAQDGDRVVSYYTARPADERLRQDFSRLTAAEQKTLIADLDPRADLSSLANKEQRVEWLNKYKTQAPVENAWTTVPARWPVILPRFERYGALDYTRPETLIQKTIKQVYEQTLYETPAGGDTPVLRQELQQVQAAARQAISASVAALQSLLQRHHPQITQVDYTPNFNFVDSLGSGEFQVNLGQGIRTLAKTGAGTRRRIFIALTEWDRDVNLAQSSASGTLPPIIRGYDEPDTNLHYHAQRQMYQAIDEVVSAANSRVQAILCTHSLTIIDRSPAQQIRHLQINPDGCTTLAQLNTDHDKDIEDFLAHLARELGITNSIIFYERCLLLVEGPTEANALPILYRRLHRRSMLEDGIRLINIDGNGATAPFLRLLARNRQEQTLIFLDEDSKTTKTTRLAERHLRDAGFNQDFIDNRLMFIGNKEFEDAFADDDLACTLNQGWPKSSPWTAAEIAGLRASAKFSDALLDVIRKEHGKSCSKPELAKTLAEHCRQDHIPKAIIDLFKQARAISSG
jgi:energy-coupling factor transporter ATP-binding protein EcfA2